MSKQQDIEIIRHSLAHIMAASVQQLYPKAQFGVGPTVDNGFYYDIYLEEPLSDKDLKKIEKGMRKIIARKSEFIKTEKTINDAIKWANNNNQSFKIELLNDIKNHGTTVMSEFDKELSVDKNKKVTFYQIGDFTDLCRGPHIKNTSDIKAFKLMRVSGAYWRGDEKNTQMQRIYGVAFTTKEELDQYLRQLEEAKKRDHRKLGKELDLFTFSPLVGAGLPMFTERGTILRDVLGEYSNQIRQKYGFKKVWTPHITKKDLYEKSGHWAKFGEELFLVHSQQNGEEFCLKPMNCPHHAQIYASKKRSYKDLPVRMLETTTPYRDEKTGELGGLSRVRSLTQDDSHVFCTPDQIENEIDNLLKSAAQIYETFDMKLRVRLSYRDDKGAYLGDEELWQKSQTIIKDMAIKNKIEYYEQEGEAAFYGPKIDFMASDAIGREHQVATVQLDFVQPDRFDLTYIDIDGQDKTPVMIHCALLGTIERFMSVFIEHTAGWFPFWTAPEQIRILTINDEVNDYVAEISDELSQIVLSKPIEFNKIRFDVDDRNESLGKKIREAIKMKIPMLIIIGEKDKLDRSVSIRLQNGKEEINKTIKLVDLKQYIIQLND